MEVIVKVPPGADRVSVSGSSDRNLKMLRESLGVFVTSKSEGIQIRGERDSVSIARRVLERLGTAAVEQQPLSRQDVLDLIAAEASTIRASSRARHGNERDPDDRDGWGASPGSIDDPYRAPVEERWDGRLNVFSSGKLVKPRTSNQQSYLEAIRDHDMVFAIGPAGTGKTYLAVAAAVHLLKTDRAKKLILVRPAVEAGERLGFLPGDMQAKVNPYLRPLFDALHDMMDFSTIRRFMENDVVEVVPLAYMRGRTLNNAIIILDEAQNTTRTQMKMFLTRLGHGSKMIVTGDATQIDLPDPSESGLIDAVRKLRRAPDVGFITLQREDVVRHPLVQRVIDAYGEEDASPTRTSLGLDDPSLPPGARATKPTYTPPSRKPSNNTR